MTTHSTLSAEFRRHDPVWYAIDDMGRVSGWHESELTSTSGMYRTREAAEAAQQAQDDAARAERDRIWGA